MPRRLSLINTRFGELKVLRLSNKIKSGKRVWECECSCGNISYVSSYRLTHGKAKSCGCKAKEMNAKSKTTHGASYSKEYVIWSGMIQRCYNPKSISYKNYGAIGVKVCQRWLDGFENFISDVGFRPTPSHSIDRINVRKGYSPHNCKWSTRIEQRRNCRNSRYIKYGGIKKHLYVWALELGISPSSLSERLSSKNWSLKEALTTPKQKSKRLHMR